MVGESVFLGWSGKLPCRGDFIEGGARLPFFKWFAEWASEGVVAVRAGGGEAADRFLTAPIYRFAAVSERFGPTLGVIGPSMDRAQRLYPFAVAAGLEGPISCSGALAANTDWLARLEEMFLAALLPDFDPVALADLTAPLVAAPPVSVLGDDAVQSLVQDQQAAPVAGSDMPGFASLFGPFAAEHAQIVH